MWGLDSGFRGEDQKSFVCGVLVTVSGLRVQGFWLISWNISVSRELWIWSLGSHIPVVTRAFQLCKPINHCTWSLSEQQRNNLSRKHNGYDDHNLLVLRRHHLHHSCKLYHPSGQYLPNSITAGTVGTVLLPQLQHYGSG